MSIRNNLAPRPPMGWNSYDTFGDFVTEVEVKAQADAMARLLLPSGWEYLVIDCGWYLPRLPDRPSSYATDLLMDGWGRAVPDERRFPSAGGGAGLRPLADYVHARGLKFGLHVMRGIPRLAAERNMPILGSPQRADQVADRQSVCPWSQGMWGMDWSQPGAQAYCNSIFSLYAQWQVDFVKMDDMVGYAKEPGTLAPYHRHDVEGAAAAVAACGRKMALSLSPGDYASPTFAPHMKEHVEMARLSADFWDNWPSLKRQFDLCPPWAEHVGEGFWPDIDMLPMGMIGLRHGAQCGPDRMTRFTPDEQRLMMTLWAIFRSPLFMGGDLTRLDDPTLALLTNPEVLAVDQHSRGARQLFRRGDHVAWTADACSTDVSCGEGILPSCGAGISRSTGVPPVSPASVRTQVGNGTAKPAKYLALFNLSDAGPTEIAVGPDELGLRGPVEVRDLWTRQNLGAAGAVRLPVPAHGVRLVRVQG